MEVLSATDRVLASRMGAKAIEVLIEGKTSRVIGIKDNKIIDQDIDEALDVESTFDQELYNIAQVLS